MDRANARHMQCYDRRPNNQLECREVAVQQEVTRGGGSATRSDATTSRENERLTGGGGCAAKGIGATRTALRVEPGQTRV